MEARLSAKEASGLLAAFRKAFEFKEGKLVALYVHTQAGRLQLEVVCEGPLPRNLPTSFQYRLASSPDFSIDVNVRSQCRYAKTLGCPPPVGGVIDRSAGGGVGTAGWTVMLDNAVVTLTAWHVIEPGVTNSLVGINQPQPPVARVMELHRPTDDDPRWDLALLALSDGPSPTFANGEELYAQQVRQCALPIGYPRKLGDLSALVLGQSVAKVGATTGRTTGTFQGFGQVPVVYPLMSGTVTVTLTEQLLIEIRAEQGDSGSLVVDAASNEALGLLVADFEGRSVANPLGEIGWQALNGPTSELPQFKRP